MSTKYGMLMLHLVLERSTDCVNGGIKFGYFTNTTASNLTLHTQLSLMGYQQVDLPHSHYAWQWPKRFAPRNDHQN